MRTIDEYQLLSSLALSLDLAEASLMSENNVVESVSNIDYGSHKFLNHSKITCYVAMKLSQIISSDKLFLQKVFLSSSLHDIGVSSIADAYRMDHFDSGFIVDHSIRGSSLMSKLPVYPDIQDIILYHHENYNGTAHFKLSGDNIPLISQIIRLSDLFELLYDSSKPNFIQRENIVKWINSKRSTIFSEYLVDVFMEVQSHDSFWWDVQNISFMPDIVSNLRPDATSTASLDDLKNIAYVFSDMIDAKSPFTFQHSHNLSRLIVDISKYLNFDEEKSGLFEVAALLHDIGKLAIPNSILNKNGRLTSTEFMVIKSHTYYTRLILSNIDGFEDITNWAANHHEKLNGKGYPIGLKGNMLSLEERIMAVCDMYEALTSKRPYKAGLPKDKALKMIDVLVEKGEICGEAVRILKEVV